MALGQLEFYFSELKDWTKSLEFYNDEIRTYNHRLEEVVVHNTGNTVLNQTEHFQNQFILQQEQFDLLRHDIHEQEKELGENMPGSENMVNQPVLHHQHQLRDRVHTAEKIFVETKHGFYRFLSSVL